MSSLVNLLLLLSALLSALTGAQAGTRPAQLAVAVAQSADSIAPTLRAAPSATVRPNAELPSLASFAAAPAWTVIPATPPLLSSRRE